MGWDHASRSHYILSEQALLHRGSGSGGMNGALQPQQEHVLGKMRYRESPSSSRASSSVSHVLEQSPRRSRHKADRSPVHDTMGDNRERQSGSPLTVQHMYGLRSVVTSPVIDSLRQAPSFSHAEQNGYCPPPPNFNDGRCSPMPSRSPRLQKLHKVQHRSDADSNQRTPSPGQESHPVLSRAERMAALERRMIANGLTAPGRSRASLGRRRLRQSSSTHVGAVQMNEGSTTSGSETSDSEVESHRGNCSSPLVSANPVEANSPIPRNKFSFGSLQLGEETDEDGCHAFSDEEGGQVFSC